ncbi:MAG: response regulator [Magnetococcus sp. YQC-5]
MKNNLELDESMEGIILLVDDQPEQLDIIKSSLDKFFIIKTTTKGEMVLKIASMGGIDLILLDIIMPGMSGYDVCRQLKSTPDTHEIPIIFLTIKDEYEDEAVGLKIGAADFIRKPSSPAIILARSRNTIALQRAKETLIRKNEDLQRALKIHEDMENMSRHDLKSPLSSILVAPYVLLNDANINLTEDHKALLRVVESSCYAILEIINRSFDLVKMEGGNYHIQYEIFDILKVLERVVGDLRHLATINGINVKILNISNGSSSIDSFLLVGEKLLCYPLFYNLILNAIEASCKDCTVSIFLSIKGCNVVVRITNSGEIPHAIRARFFDKYVTFGKKKGTGLGTYSAWLAAKTQGGTIDLDTSRIGETSIIVTLPSPKSS